MSKKYCLPKHTHQGTALRAVPNDKSPALSAALWPPDLLFLQILHTSLYPPFVVILLPGACESRESFFDFLPSRSPSCATLVFLNIICQTHGCSYGEVIAQYFKESR